jgi:hypothetical protein
MRNYTFYLLIIFLVLIVIMCTGCFDHNVRHGDRDYPVVNNQHKQALSVHGTIDPILNVKFASYWIVTNNVRWPVADGNCNYTFNWLEGVSDRYSVRQPITPTMHDNNYEFEIATDEFLPGRCGWKFSGILVYTNHQAYDSMFPIDAAELIVAYNPNLPNWANLIKTNENHLDLSCKNDAYTDGQSGHGSGPYLKCVDSKSHTRIRALLQEGETKSFELNIHNDPNLQK